MRTRARVGLVATMTTLLVGMASGVAYADYSTSDCVVSYNDPNGVNCWVTFWHEGIAVGEGEFQAYDERMVASDLHADGRGVYVSVSYYDSDGDYRFYNHWATRGAGTTDVVDLHMPEGTNVHFTSCQTDNGNLYNCTDETANA